MAAFLVGQPQVELSGDDIAQIRGFLVRLLGCEVRSVVASVLAALGHLYSYGRLGEGDFCLFESAFREACACGDPVFRVPLLFAAVSVPCRGFLEDFVVSQLRCGDVEVVSWALLAVECAPYPFVGVDPVLLEIAGDVDSDVAVEALILLVRCGVGEAVGLVEQLCTQGCECDECGELVDALAESADERFRDVYRRLIAP